MEIERRIGYFTPEECKKIIKRADELFISLPHPNAVFSEDLVGSDVLMWPREEDDWIWKKMKELYTGVEFHRNMGVNRYHVGDSMMPHKDDVQGDGFILNVSLNDEFEGGDLTLVNDDKSERYIVPIGIGNANIFHSGITHGVSKITSGMRYSLGQQVFITNQFPRY